MLLMGDKVKYVGRKYSAELGTKLGEVVASVSGEDSMLVVDFGDDAYVVREFLLRKLTPTRDGEGPEFSRKRRNEDE